MRHINLLIFIVLLSMANLAKGQNSFHCDSIYQLYLGSGNSFELVDELGVGAYENNLYCLSGFQLTPSQTTWCGGIFKSLDIEEGDTLNIYVGGKTCENLRWQYTFTKSNSANYMDLFYDDGFNLDFEGGYIEIEWITDELNQGEGWELEISMIGVIDDPLIGGKLYTELEIPIENAALHFSSDGPDLIDSIKYTNENGSNYIDYWYISNFQDTVFLEPKTETNHINGVTAFDMVKILKHILGTEILDSNYKMVAADVNESGAITALDLVWMRKLILGIEDKFPAGRSWRYISKCEDFSDGFGMLKETAVFTGTIPKAFQEFIGVKLGDVNNSADPKLN